MTKYHWLSYGVILLLMTPVLWAVEYHVKDHGVIGDGINDDGPALRRVFRLASQSKTPATIIFETEKSYYIAPYKEAHGRLMLREAANVTIEGHNAILVVHPPNRALGIHRSRNIGICNLQIDYRPLPFTQGTITRIDNRQGVLEFKPHHGYAPPVEGDASLYQDGRNEDSITFNQDDRKFYHAHSRINGIESLGEDRFRVSYRGHRFTEARVGDFFAMKNRWGPRTGLRHTNTSDPARNNEYISTADPSIMIAHSERVRLENIRSYAAPGMTLNARGCSNLEIQGLRIQRHGDRLVASCSDGIHLKCNESPPVIRDCFIEGTMDDAIHIKISGDWITEVISPRRVKIRHMDIAWDNTNLGPGKRVMVYDHDSKRELATATIVDYQAIDYRQAWVTLDRDVPDMAVQDSLYLEATGEALIDNCHFGTQLQRAILTHQPTLIRSCTIEDNGQGIVVGFTGIEGPPSQRLRVEDCTFTRLQYRAISVTCPSKIYDQKGNPQFICSDSLFNLAPGVPAFHITRSRGVSLRNNRYLYIGPEPDLDQYRLLIDSPLHENITNRFIPEMKGFFHDK
jgi:hypothetical protein